VAPRFHIATMSVPSSSLVEPSSARMRGVAGAQMRMVRFLLARCSEPWARGAHGAHGPVRCALTSSGTCRRGWLLATTCTSPTSSSGLLDRWARRNRRDGGHQAGRTLPRPAWKARFSSPMLVRPCTARRRHASR